MKKMKLITQLFLIFSVATVFSMFIFSVLVNLSLSNIFYENIEVDQLDRFVQLTEGEWENLDKPLTDEFQYVIGNTNGEKHYSNNIKNFVDLADMRNIVELITDSEIHQYSGYYKTEEKGEIYVSAKMNDSGSYIIAVSDHQTISTLKNKTVRDLIVIFILNLLAGNAIVIIWSRNLVKRLETIQEVVKELPTNNYKDEVVDEGFDEIGELAKSINNMSLEIKHNEDIKQEMLQNISHDFKTPIAVIKSYAEAILDGTEGLNEGMDVILKQAEVLRKKAYQLLEFNKLEFLDQKKDFEDINMEDVCKNVIENYRFQTNARFELDLRNVYFKGFQENYYIVVDNIICNAIRYAKSVIRITLRENELCVYNDGPKINEEFINNIFKPYEKSSKGQFGLGMSIVQKTVNYFDMKIEVKNLDVGVEFKIYK